MKMRILNTTIFFVWQMDSKISSHATAEKLLRYKLPCKSDVFLQRKLVLQGNIETICKLCLFAAFSLLHGVPEN